MALMLMCFFPCFFFPTISLLDTSSGLHDSTSTTSRVKAKVPGSLIGARFMSTQTVRTAKQDQRGKAKIQKVTVHIYFSVVIQLPTLHFEDQLVHITVVMKLGPPDFFNETNRLKGVFYVHA